MIAGRSHNNDLIEKAFINNILEEEAENIARVQDRVLSNAEKDKRIELVRYNRNFSVSNQKLTHTHNIQQRFIDMKRTRYGKQKPVKVHNSIIFGHWNNILWRVHTNLTEAVRAQIANQLNIELYG